MSKPPESHYNINKLHVIFALLALTLLAGLGGLFLKDYGRTWKDYQREYRTMDVEKSRIKADIAQEDLNNNPEYTALIAKIDEAKKEYAEKCNTSEDLKREIARLETEQVLLNQESKDVNTALGVAKFQLEEASAHHPTEVDEKKHKYDDLSKKASVLKEKIAKSKETLDTKQSAVDECGLALKDLERQQRKFTMDLDLTKRKLKTIDPNEMSFINQIANMIRDLPVLDLSTPREKIQQLVIKDITDDLTFTKVPKVERCITCHQGIINPAFKDADQPFRTHPNLELYVGNNSKHPIEEFGCTVCHGGRGRGTDFTTAVHTPSSEEQRKEWTKKYGWKEYHHWEDPMLPKPYFEAGCFKCHDSGTIKGADKLNMGLHLIEKAGCYNCHLIDKYKAWPKTGPTLTKVAEKLSKDWIYKWIESPQSFRPNTWMPSYFNQSNNSDPASKARSEQEILAMTHYLYTKSENKKSAPEEFTGDAKNGEELVASLGCFACHKIDSKVSENKTTRSDLFREHGPGLTGLGTKTTKAWLVDWLKDPTRYHPDTRMPNMRLSDQDAVDIAEYLYKDNNIDFATKEIPAVNENVLSEIVFDFVKGTTTQENAKKQVETMPVDEKLMFAGEKLIGHYGCYSCHNIPGFEKQKPIGIELTYEGDKPLNKLDFGFIHDIEHSKQGWFSEKLHNPRVFDTDKVLSFEEKSRMPNYYLKKDEIEAIITAILGFTDDATVRNKKPKIEAKTPFVQAGQELVKQFNCQACHIIEGEGGYIQPTVQDWLLKHEGATESDAAKSFESYSPPNLHGAGKKLDPEWLFKFLHQPETVRPWVKVRMPTYHLNTSHLNMLVKYFNYLDDEEFPFHEKTDLSLTDEEYKAAEKMFSKEVFGCNLCHVVGNQLPTGSAESWAPNLALAKTRLKPGWMIDWIKDPAKLMPGTKMPAFWDPNDFENAGPPDILNGDENEQIRVLRNYLTTFADHPPVAETPTNSTQTPAASNSTGTTEDKNDVVW